MIDWDSISEEKTNLAYDSGLSFLSELEESQKNIDTKALVFLYYLFTICGVLLYNLIFGKINIVNLSIVKCYTLTQIIFTLFIGYSFLFCIASLVFLTTQRRANKFAKPYDILQNPNNITQYIKNNICIGLQDAISFNLKKIGRRALALKILLLISILFPISTIFYLTTQYSFLFVLFASFIIFVALLILFLFYPQERHYQFLSSLQVRIKK